MSRLAPIALVLLAGCFNPRVTSGGFLCDPTQTPSCPTGLFCIDNRCVDHLIVGGASDLAIEAADLSGSPLNDLAQQPAGDMSQSGGPGDMAGSGGSCVHSRCVVGVKLANGCDPCVTQICTADSYCCVTKWSSQCVAEVTSICSKSCP